MSGRKRVRKHREKMKPRKLIERFGQYENLSSEDEMLSVNNDLPKGANSESVVPDNVVYSDSSDISDKGLVDSKDSRSSSSDIEENDAEMNADDEIQEISELRQWAIDNNIAHSDLDQLLKILKRRLLPDLPLCSKTFLKSNIKFNLESMEVSDGSSGEFYYFGLKKQLKDTVIKPELHTSNTLELIFNIDGVSPFKSSTISVWPTLCKIYTKDDAYKPFAVSIYAGHGKPKSASQYLSKFVSEINSLHLSGIHTNDKHFDVQVKFFVCDTPARSFLKSVVGHVAFKGCERCNVIGHKVDGVTVFMDTSATERTDNDFRTFVDPDCHTGVSLLSKIEPQIDLVRQFVLDPMHLLYLGCAKRILEYLLSSSTSKARLSPSLKEELQRRTQAIQKDIPDEFPRKMRPSNTHNKYKAVEFKFFMLYAAPFVLKKLLSDELYYHLMLFVTSIRLLSQKDPMQFVPLARVQLQEFVNKSSSLYGSTFVPLNVHNLIHVSSDVEKTDLNLNDKCFFI